MEYMTEASKHLFFFVLILFVQLSHVCPLQRYWYTSAGVHVCDHVHSVEGQIIPAPCAKPKSASQTHRLAAVVGLSP